MRAQAIPSPFRRVRPTHLALSIALGLAGCGSGSGSGDDAGAFASAMAAVERAESRDSALAKAKSTVGSMTVARLDHTATLLANDKVLVAGGFDSSDDLSSCEFYDPATKQWSAGPEMKLTHRKARAVVLGRRPGADEWRRRA